MINIRGGRGRGYIRNVRGVSPAVSAVILTAAIMVLVLVAVNFATTFLEARISESEFASVKQFMQTAAVQVDDVAWTPWRTQTFRHSCKYGSMNFISDALNYTIYYKNASGEYHISELSGILTFKMPISKYNMYDGYFDLVYPTSDSLVNSLVFRGANAPVARVFAIEKLSTGNYVRLILNPCVRIVEANVSGEKQYKVYLPILYKAEPKGNNPTVTFTSTQLSSLVIPNVTEIRIVVTSLIYDADFFVKSPASVDKITDEVIDVDDGSTLILYISEVRVSIGVHP